MGASRQRKLPWPRPLSDQNVISMKQKLVFALILSACSITANFGQFSDGTAIIEALNERLASVKKGVFSIQAEFKFADGNDTIAHEGLCYFFRESNADSFAQFVVLTDGEPVLAFDGTRFYQTFGKDKFRVTDVEKADGIRRMLRGNVLKSNLVYQPLFRIDQPNFATEDFEKIILSAESKEGQRILRLTSRDTTIQTALGDVENNKIISTYSWDIALPDFYLVRRTGVVWLLDGWQYDQKIFSPITPLPAEAKLADYFDPEKLAETYTFEEYDPNQRPKRDIELIKTGDVLPDFSLLDLEGKTVRLKDQKKGLLLLDFWYKGCFPCQLAMPKIERLHQKYASKGLMVLGVNPVDENSDQLKSWLESRKVSYNTIFDPERLLPKAVGIQGYPLLVIADAKTKKVLYVHPGYSADMEQDLEPIIAKILR